MNKISDKSNVSTSNDYKPTQQIHYYVSKNTQKPVAFKDLVSNITKPILYSGDYGNLD